MKFLNFLKKSVLPAGLAILILFGIGKGTKAVVDYVSDLKDETPIVEVEDNKDDANENEAEAGENEAGENETDA